MPPYSFAISAVAEELFDMARVDPARVNKAMERRLGSGGASFLRPADRHPTIVRHSTGVPLRLIHRRNLHLLLVIEERAPLWRYQEENARACAVWIAARLPEAAMTALVGRPLSAVLGPVPCLSSQTIRCASTNGNGTRIEIRVGWSRR